VDPSVVHPPNALASAARAPFKSQMDARRRRPCRLHAVIRALVLDGSGALGRPTQPPCSAEHPTLRSCDVCLVHPPGPSGAAPECHRNAKRCAPHRMAVPVRPRSFCPGEPMALCRHRQRSRCRPPLSEFNASAATRLAISGAGTRDASLYRIAALARSPRSVGAGPLERPNALASAARAPINSVTGAERRRPCRLHAVIRQALPRA
jgi:hypothetical protein